MRNFPEGDAGSTTRRSLLVAGGVGLAAAVQVGAPVPAEAASSSSDRVSIDVLDHGAKANGKSDDTAAFASAVAAAAKVRGRVVVPAGTYVIDSLRVPLLVKIQGLGADVSRYGASTDGGVNLRHNPDSSSPMIVVDGNGVTLENLGMQANGSKAPLLRVDNGFESRFSRLQLSGVNGTALHVERVNNNYWTDVFVNNCGSESDAAVVVKSPKTGTNSNTFTCINLTIEASPGTALDLGAGASADYYVEFVRLVGLHIEALQSTTGLDPIVRIGNVRQVEFVSPIIYGGPAPLLEHRQTRSRGNPLEAGVRLVGGVLLGADPARVPSPEILVDLVAGDDFALVGTRLGRYSKAGVSIRSSYGPRVSIDPGVRSQSWGTSVPLDDQRVHPPEHIWSWPGGVSLSRSLAIGGHLLSGSGAAASPTVSWAGAGAKSGVAPTVRGTDVAGVIEFRTGTAPQTGAHVRLTFATAFSSPPTVVVTPASAAASGASSYVEAAADHVDVCLSGVVSAAQTLRFSYQVIG
jgi:hypothetical protein